MLLAVDPLLQVLPASAEEVSVTEPPSQKLSGPDAVMVGVPEDMVTCKVCLVPLPQVLDGITLMECVPAVVQLTVAELLFAVSVPPPDKAHV